MREITDCSQTPPFTTYYSNSIFPVIVNVARKYSVKYEEITIRGGCEVWYNNRQVGEIRPEEMCDLDWELID